MWYLISIICCKLFLSQLCSDMFCNKTVDIKFSAHDTFLEWPSSGTLKDEWLGSKKKSLCAIHERAYWGLQFVLWWISQYYYIYTGLNSVFRKYVLICSDFVPVNTFICLFFVGNWSKRFYLSTLFVFCDFRLSPIPIDVTWWRTI